MGEKNLDKLSKDDFVPAAEATERGYSGYTPDDTPNEDYTVAGVTKAAAAKPAEKAPVVDKPAPARGK